MIVTSNDNNILMYSVGWSVGGDERQHDPPLVAEQPAGGRPAAGQHGAHHARPRRRHQGRPQHPHLHRTQRQEEDCHQGYGRKCRRL